MEKKIITRFAPSPTGELHIGGARTALFEYLFAKHNGGQFLLRIEDTDRERYVEDAEKRIIESLKWLGIEPDNIAKPVIQSDHLEVYKKQAFDLVKAGHAYICTCSKEELAKERERQEKSGLPPRYSGKCRDVKCQMSNVKDMESSILGGAVVRMKMPKSGKIVVHDLIRGDVEFDLSLLDDQVILKSDGFPTYHLASVVDDHEMEITDVIRAEEWLSSTPKHLVLYQMFGWQPPKFAHLPMVLAPDRSKLSKRHGATSVVEYKNLGYLPEAIVNFLALQGWNPKDEREIFSLEELVQEFKIENVGKSPAVFNVEKLNSINEHYIQSQISNLKSQNDNLKVKSYLTNFGADDLTSGELELLGRGGYKTLKEAAEYILKLRKEPKYEPALLVFKKSTKEKTATALRAVELRIKNYELWDNDSLQKLLSDIVLENNLTNGDVFWPVRVALSGEEKSPSPVELAMALGKEETTKRIQKAIEKSSHTN